MRYARFALAVPFVVAGGLVLAAALSVALVGSLFIWIGSMILDGPS